MKTTTDGGVVPALLGALCVAAAAPLRPSLRTAAIALGAVLCGNQPVCRVHFSAMTWPC